MINAYFAIVIEFFDFIYSILNVEFVFGLFTGTVFTLSDYIFFVAMIWVFLRMYALIIKKRG